MGDRGDHQEKWMVNSCTQPDEYKRQRHSIFNCISRPYVSRWGKSDAILAQPNFNGPFSDRPTLTSRSERKDSPRRPSLLRTRLNIRHRLGGFCSTWYCCEAVTADFE